MARKEIFGKETVAGTREVRDAVSEISSILEDFDVSSLSEGMQQIVGFSQDFAQTLSESQQYSSENVDLAKQQAKNAKLGVQYATSESKVKKLIRGIQIKLVKGGDEFTNNLKGSVSGFEDMKGAAQEVGDIMEDRLKAGLGDIDGMFGGIGQAIGGALTNPLGAIVGIATTIFGRIDAIGAAFGGMGVTKFKDDLLDANKAFIGMGLSGEDAYTSVQTLTSEFGVGMQEAIGMAESVGDLAKSTGMAVEDSAKLVGFFQMSSGLSGEQATNLLKSADALAVANGVAPGAVLKDIAENTQTFAEFGKDGGEGLMRAAISAKKLGISLGTVAKTADSLLDFQSSLNAEVEASVMLGRNVNLQKARELALTGDMEGLQQEILNVVGSEAEFNAMNVMQRRSLARALGMEVGELQKVVMNQGKAADLQGEMAEQELPTPEESMSAMAESMASIQEAFMTIMDEHGETFEAMFTSLAESVPGIVEGIGGFVSYIDESIGLGNALVGVLALMGTKAIVTAVASIYASFAQIPLGIGIPLAIAAAIAFQSMISGIGDGFIPSVKSGESPVVSTQEGAFRISPNDDMIIAPNLRGGGAGGGGANNSAMGSVISNAMKPLLDENRKQRQQLADLTSETKRQASRFAEAIGDMA